MLAILCARGLRHSQDRPIIMKSHLMIRMFQNYDEMPKNADSWWSANEYKILWNTNFTVAHTSIQVLVWSNV